jgi:uncharacterized protein YjcR
MELYLQGKGQMQLNEIADRLNLSEGTVRGWKAKDDWEGVLNGTAASRSKKNTERSEPFTERSKRNAKTIPSNNKSIKTQPGKKDHKTKPETNSITRKQPSQARPGNRNAAGTHRPGAGAPIENQNAIGNAGGRGGPARNKHALTTGEYESIFFDEIVDDTERALLAADYDKYRQIFILIDTLTIREKRIMKRIRETEATPGGMVFDSITKTKGGITTKFKNRNKDGDEWPGNDMIHTSDNSSHVAKPVMKRVMDLEDALTRVQAQKRQAIAQLHRMELNDDLYNLAEVKVDISLIKAESAVQASAADEAEGDNFIESLENITGEVWKDDSDAED